MLNDNLHKNRHYIEITKKKIIIQESTKTMFKKK